MNYDRGMYKAGSYHRPKAYHEHWTYWFSWAVVVSFVGYIGYHVVKALA